MTAPAETHARTAVTRSPPVPPEPPVGTWMRDKYGALSLRQGDGWGLPGFWPFGKWEAMWEARGPYVECEPWGRSSIPVMTTPSGPPPATEATLGDLLVHLKRIADALEAHSPRCGEVRSDAICALLPSHKGYHVTADGREMWLDD